MEIAKSFSKNYLIAMGNQPETRDLLTEIVSARKNY